MLKVLITDELSPSVGDIFRAAGIEADAETGLSTAALIAYVALSMIFQGALEVGASM